MTMGRLPKGTRQGPSERPSNDDREAQEKNKEKVKK